jgi:hypothetical protein
MRQDQRTFRHDRLSRSSRGWGVARRGCSSRCATGQGDGGSFESHITPQIGQCTNHVSRWEYAVVIRVAVRIPCEADLAGDQDALPGARQPVRPRANVGAHGRVPTWLTEAGPPGQIAPAALNTEARPQIGAELLR